MHPILLALAAHAAQVRNGPWTTGEGMALIVVLAFVALAALAGLVRSLTR